MVKTLKSLVAAVMIGLAGTPAIAATTTVGGNGLKTTGGTVQPVPSQYLTPQCFTVSLSTNAFTQVLPQDLLRASWWIVNASTMPMNGVSYTAAGGTSNPFRPPFVYLSTTTATNLGSGGAGTSTFVQSLLPTLNAMPLAPYYTPNVGTGVGSQGFFTGTNDTMWSQAIFAIAEASSTVTYNPLGVIQGCYIRP